MPVALAALGPPQLQLAPVASPTSAVLECLTAQTVVPAVVAGSQLRGHLVVTVAMEALALGVLAVRLVPLTRPPTPALLSVRAEQMEHRLLNSLGCRLLSPRVVVVVVLATTVRTLSPQVF